MPDNIINQHSTTLLKSVVATFNEERNVRSGFKDFFPMATTPSELVDIAVRRDSDTIAVDVERYTEGNHVKSTRTTERLYKPPFYKEIYDFSRDEVYMSAMALGNFADARTNQIIAQNALDNLRKMRNKIDRAIQKQQADVLQTGVVSLTNGDNINYRRKADSMVDLGAGNYWNEAGVDPIADIETACKFIRNEGASGATELNMVMRSSALRALLDNAKVKETANFRRISRLDISMPQFNGVSGLAFHGVLAAGDFQVMVWTYEEKYTDENGTLTYYLDSNKVVFLPTDFQGVTVHAGLPALMDANFQGVQTRVPTVVETDYLLRSYWDERTISSGIELTSAPLIVPTTVDRMYTIQALA